MSLRRRPPQPKYKVGDLVQYIRHPEKYFEIISIDGGDYRYIVNSIYNMTPFKTVFNIVDFETRTKLITQKELNELKAKFL